MIDYLLLKIASRCNLDCTYCYWFRDETVRALPALMSEKVIGAFLSALERHVVAYEMQSFTCSFHGGEPTLFGAERLRRLIQRIEGVGAKTGCRMEYALTTNACLIDSEWIDLIREFNIGVAVSIDGPQKVHDRRRVTVRGAPTWKETVTGYLALCQAGIKPSILAVCDPIADPVSVMDHFAGDLGVMFCDVLIPDLNHTDTIEPVAPFYIGLFDRWYDRYMDRGVEVRILKDFVRGLLGLETTSDSVGFAPISTVVLNPAGVLEPLDTLRIAGNERVRTKCDIFSHEIADIMKDEQWLYVNKASTTLCDTCNSCRYRAACGGGHIAQRWSVERQYNNPSVYCADFIAILDHIAGRLKKDIRILEKDKAMDSDKIYEALRSGNARSILAAS